MMKMLKMLCKFCTWVATTKPAESNEETESLTIQDFSSACFAMYIYYSVIRGWCCSCGGDVVS